MTVISFWVLSSRREALPRTVRLLHLYTTPRPLSLAVVTTGDFFPRHHLPTRPPSPPTLPPWLPIATAAPPKLHKEMCGPLPSCLPPPKTSDIQIGTNPRCSCCSCSSSRSILASPIPDASCCPSPPPPGQLDPSFFTPPAAPAAGAEVPARLAAASAVSFSFSARRTSLAYSSLT